MWLFKIATCNYYVWLVVIVLLWPVAVFVDACAKICLGFVDAGKEILDGFTGPAWQRKQFNKLRRKYWK